MGTLASPTLASVASAPGPRGKTPALDVLVLNARQRQSLVAVRSLGSHGLTVGAVGPTDRVPAFHSRWCRRAFAFAAADGSDGYLALLEELLQAVAPRVIIPSHDGTIALLRRHRERLAALSHLALASEAALTVAVSKEQTLDVAARLGLRVPRGILVRSPDDLPRALREIGLPAVIKPNESWLWQDGGGTGAWVGPRLVTTDAEAERAARDFTRCNGAALVQQYLTGRREAVSLVYADGQVHARFAQWASRTLPPLGGESIMRQSIPIPPDIGRQAEALIGEIDLEGYSEVEFRRDDRGAPYLMEINPRLSASVELAVRAGVDFPLLIYQWASGAPIDRVERYRTGQWMRHLGGDILTTVETIQQRGRPGVTPPLRALAEFGSAFFRPMRYDYLDPGDPQPALVATAGFTHYAVGRIVSRLRKSFS